MGAPSWIPAHLAPPGPFPAQGEPIEPGVMSFWPPKLLADIAFLKRACFRSRRGSDGTAFSGKPPHAHPNDESIGAVIWRRPSPVQSRPAIHERAFWLEFVVRGVGGCVCRMARSQDHSRISPTTGGAQARAFRKGIIPSRCLTRRPDELSGK